MPRIKAGIAAVNHNGSSNSTSVITSSILGAYLGLSGIPKKHIDNLKLVDVLTELAWEKKYVYINYSEKAND